jgi:hypothetical protein
MVYRDDSTSYDFSKYHPINFDPASVTKFTNIVWAATKKVAFAYRDNHALLVYCNAKVNEKTCYGCGSTGCTATNCKAGAVCTTASPYGYCDNIK